MRAQRKIRMVNQASMEHEKCTYICAFGLQTHEHYLVQRSRPPVNIQAREAPAASEADLLQHSVTGAGREFLLAVTLPCLRHKLSTSHAISMQYTGTTRPGLRRTMLGQIAETCLHPKKAHLFL